MSKISYRGFRFPPDIIQRAVWLYFRFTLSFRDVEDLLAERGIEVSYETIRHWVTGFGPAITRHLRSRRPRPHGQWHLDEMFVSIGGKWTSSWSRSHDGCGRRRPKRYRNILTGGSAIRIRADLDYVPYAAFHGGDPDHQRMHRLADPPGA